MRYAGLLAGFGDRIQKAKVRAEAGEARSLSASAGNESRVAMSALTTQEDLLPSACSR